MWNRTVIFLENRTDLVCIETDVCFDEIEPHCSLFIVSRINDKQWHLRVHT